MIPFAGLFSGRQLGPTDHIQTMVTPESPAPTSGWDVLQADGVLQFYPWRDLVFAAYRQGEAPIINPYQLAGQPLTGNSQSGGFYPLHVLFAFIPLSTQLKMVLLAILHGVIAGAGMFIWLRQLKATQAGAMVGALLFTNSQFMIAWAPLASVPTTVAWIPWILAGLHMRNKQGVIIIALASGLLLLAGHLQFAAYGMLATLVYLSWIVVSPSPQSEPKWKIVLPIIGLMLGGLMAYPQLNLVLANSANSHRKNTPSEEGYTGYIKGALQPFEAISAIHPKLLGSTTAPTSELKDSGLPSGYWPLYVKPNSNPAECALWIFPAGIAFAMFAFRSSKPDASDNHAGTNRPYIGPLAIVLLGFLLAFGTPLNKLLFFGFPGWSATGSPSRALILIVIGLCALAGLGATRMEETDTNDKKWLAVVAIPLIFLAIGFNALNLMPQLLQPGSEDFKKIVALLTKGSMLEAIIPILASVGVLLLWVKSTNNPKIRWLSIALVAGSGIFTQVSSGPLLQIPASSIPSQERSATQSTNWNIAVTPKASMPPNLNSIRREHDLFGYDSILEKGFVEQLKQATQGDPAPPENGNMMLYRGGASKESLRQLGVGDNARIEGGTIIHDGFDHQIIKPNPGVDSILIRDRFMEGMTVSPMDVIIQNKNGFRDVLITSDFPSEIRIDYPGRHGIKIVLAIFSILLLFLFGTFTNRNRNHEPQSP